MAWARIDDSILDHPKILAAGEDARDLLIAGIVYCNRHLTDGRIPHEAITILTRRRHYKRTIQTLLEHGLWVERAGFWEIAGFLDWNESRAEIEAKKAASAERMKKSRERRAAESPQNTPDVALQRTRNERASSPSVAAPTPLHSTPIEEEDPPLPPAGAGAPSAAAPSKRTRKRNQASEIGARVLARMNELSGKTLEYSPQLEARISEGIREADLVVVAEHQWRREFMRLNREYYRPSTLYGPDKFREYLAEARAGPLPATESPRSFPGRPPVADEYRNLE